MKIKLLYFFYLLILLMIFTEVTLRLSFAENYLEDIRWRTRSIHQLDDKMVYGLKPESQIFLTDILYKGLVSVDSEGFRTTVPEHSVAQKTVILGDSMVFGFGVKDSETMSSFLSQKLSMISKVINAGVDGYHVGHYKKLLENKIIGMSPENVVMGIYINDLNGMLEKPIHYIESGLYKDIPIQEIPLYRVLKFNKMLPDFISDLRLIWAINHFFIYGKILKSSRQNVSTRQDFIHLIEDAAKASIKNKIRLLVVALPCSKLDLGCLQDGSTYDWLNVLSEQGIEFRDLSKNVNCNFSSYDPGDVFIKGDIHYSKLGNEVLAGCMANLLSAK